MFSCFVFREIANEVKTNTQKPSVARANLQKKIEEQYPESTADAMLKLPKRRAVNRTFQTSRKAARTEDVDPTAISEELYVSLH
jgi:hypothetical protein